MNPEMDILIVEDEQGQREMLAGFLENVGHRVSMAECGRAALDRVTRETFDLMVLDYRMPDMNGIAVLQQARQIDPDIDIVMVTAYGTIENAVEAMKAGAGGGPVRDDRLQTRSRGGSLSLSGYRHGWFAG